MSKKLNLGRDEKYKKGWVNLDISNKNIYGNKIINLASPIINLFPIIYERFFMDFFQFKNVSGN